MLLLRLFSAVVADIGGSTNTSSLAEVFVDNRTSGGGPVEPTGEPVGPAVVSVADVDACPLRRFLPVLSSTAVVSTARFRTEPRPGRGCATTVGDVDAAEAAGDVTVTGALNAAANLCAKARFRRLFIMALYTISTLLRSTSDCAVAVLNRAATWSISTLSR